MASKLAPVRAPNAAPGAGEAAQVFTVRLWRHGARWRFAVRPAGAGSTMLLESPAELAAYFAGALDAIVDATPPPAAG